MGMDALSQALAARRGKGLDASLFHGASQDITQNNSDQDVRKGLAAGLPGGGAGVGGMDPAHGGIDSRLGVDGKASANGEMHGTNTGTEHSNLPNPGVQHTAVMNESQGMSPPADRNSKTHLDEHTMVVNEASGTPLPKSQSTGMGEGELQAQIRQHVIGHESENEHEQLASHKPRSIGERAKMMAMKEKYNK